MIMFRLRLDSVLKPRVTVIASLWLLSYYSFILFHLWFFLDSQTETETQNENDFEMEVNIKIKMTHILLYF